MITPTSAVLAAVSIPICIIDFRERRIPDFLTLGGLVATLILGWVLAPEGLIDQFTGAAFGFWLFWILNRVTDGGIGMGDAKYSALVGAALGAVGWFWALLLSALLGSAVGGSLLATGRIDRDYRIPFAPFLA
ncbi:MAG TPA: A24 family peptidase, partial [Spirochaetia bacterium]|nr:A24 family peptidase [Spirochaetia bacterium]